MMRNMNAGLASVASSVSSRSSRRSRNSNVSLGFGVGSMVGNMIRGMSTPNFDEEDSSSEEVEEEEEPEIYMDPSCLLALQGSTVVSQSLNHSAPGRNLDIMTLFKENAEMSDGSRMQDRSRRSVMDWFKANAEMKDDSKASRQHAPKQSARLRGNAVEDAIAGILEEEEEIDFLEATKNTTSKGFAELDEGAMMDFLSEDLAPMMVEPSEAFSDASTDTDIDPKEFQKEDITGKYLDDLITSGEAVIQEGHGILQSTRGLEGHKFFYDTDATDTEILQSGSSESKALENRNAAAQDGQTDTEKSTHEEAMQQGHGIQPSVTALVGNKSRDEIGATNNEIEAAEASLKEHVDASGQETQEKVTTAQALPINPHLRRRPGVMKNTEDY